jgi:hypothetical protein
MSFVFPHYGKMSNISIDKWLDFGNVEQKVDDINTLIQFDTFCLDLTTGSQMYLLLVALQGWFINEWALYLLRALMSSMDDGKYISAPKFWQNLHAELYFIFTGITSAIVFSGIAEFEQIIFSSFTFLLRWIFSDGSFHATTFGWMLKFAVQRFFETSFRFSRGWFQTLTSVMSPVIGSLRQPPISSKWPNGFAIGWSCVRNY